MENYQILGLVGSILLLVFIVPAFMFFFNRPYMMGGMMGYGFMMMGFPFFFMFIPAFILGIIGSLINDRMVAGILLILASIFSLPFGFLGIIPFILLLIAGILALTTKK
ncbi:hypothetical protein EWF20_06310 [Sulfolobus sp. S-194]|uniref:hypothetical protein n=1 Tax=Sulfolobus sp. S-194 TaxID=2512240 RepID=UPI0014370E4A|nr:hypothetical protein [Sulfolobus sp. S-194]QIW23805.1 hypothetical protein EWF20_06310 [Sulfolobus sp. S-194]